MGGIDVAAPEAYLEDEGGDGCRGQDDGDELEARKFQNGISRPIEPEGGRRHGARG